MRIFNRRPESVLHSEAFKLAQHGAYRTLRRLRTMIFFLKARKNRSAAKYKVQAHVRIALDHLPHHTGARLLYTVPSKLTGTTPERVHDKLALRRESAYILPPHMNTPSHMPADVHLPEQAFRALACAWPGSQLLERGPRHPNRELCFCRRKIAWGTSVTCCQLGSDYIRHQGDIYMSGCRGGCGF
jgi:hypothetical protein